MGRGIKDPRTRLKLDPGYQEHVRAKISVSGIEARLAEHIKDKNGGTMSPSQVTAALGLLKKIVPDLSATELTGSVSSYVARIPAPAKTVDDWKNSLSKPQGSPLTADKPKPVGDSGQVH